MSQEPPIDRPEPDTGLTPPPDDAEGIRATAAFADAATVQVDVSDTSPLPPAPPDGLPARTAGAQTGEHVGRYTLVHPIGEGSFGSVWLAEQREPVRRWVALKIIKLGMDTRDVIVRFEAERQALAMMDHPSIAKVLDAGSTDAGRPYFVMEYIQGVPLIEYCDRERLDTRRRLELFIPVCHAIQHAHQKGIIHRDIKPSNVLVTLQDGVPLPKVIDFGIAKATNTELTQRSLFTEHGQIVGTPAYMSPEQAELGGMDIDTRSDIYSLGALLYELLTGAMPFGDRTLAGRGMIEMLRTIREVDPPRPSARLSDLGAAAITVVTRRGTDVRRLGLTLRGDLDWIVMKCLEKDRARRYETASGLATDIQRHLGDEPVLAGPPSAVYRVRKFVKRRRGQVIAAGLVAASLLLGLAGTTTGMIRALGEKQRAERAETATRHELARANAVIALIEDMFDSADPNEQKGADYTVRQLLDDFGRTVRTQFAGQPLVEAAIRRTVGSAYLGLGLPDDAEPHLTTALDLYRRESGSDDAQLAWLRYGLIRVAYDRGQYAQTELLIRGLLQEVGHREELEELRRVLARFLTTVVHRQGRYGAAESLGVESLDACRRMLGDEHPETVAAMYNLAAVYADQGRYSDAEPLFRKTLDIRTRDLGETHPDSVTAMGNLAILFQKQGRFVEAERLTLQALALTKRVRGESHPDTLALLNSLALIYQSQGRYTEAEPLLASTLDSLERTLGEEHPSALSFANNLATLYQDQGRYDEAEDRRLKSMAIEKRVLGPEHPATLATLCNLAGLYTLQGRYEEAEPIAREALAVQQRVLGEEHPDTLRTLNNLAILYLEQGRYDDGEPLCVRALDIKRRVLGRDHPSTVASMENLAVLYKTLGRYDDAAPLLVEALEIETRVLGAEHVETLSTAASLGGVYNAMGDFSAAVDVLERNLPLMRRVLGAEHALTRTATSELAKARAGRGAGPNDNPPRRRDTGG